MPDAEDRTVCTDILKKLTDFASVLDNFFHAFLQTSGLSQ